jgi:two-component system, NtrC family, nitrogen regulation response regulator GlnG
VRQLENLCHWLTVMAPAQVVEAKDLPPDLLEGMSDSTASRVAASPTTPLAVPAHALAPAGPDLAPFDGGSGSPQAPFTEPVAWSLAPAAGAVAAPAFAPALAPEAAWLQDLQLQARRLLDGADPEVWDTLTRQFEACLIQTALQATRGRRIEAAQRLGIGRNTITRKIQELGLEG